MERKNENQALLAHVAQIQGVSEEELLQTLQEMLEKEVRNPSPVLQARWSGKTPTVEEFVAYKLAEAINTAAYPRYMR